MIFKNYVINTKEVISAKYMIFNECIEILYKNNIRQTIECVTEYEWNDFSSVLLEEIE